MICLPGQVCIFTNVRVHVKHRLAMEMKRKENTRAFHLAFQVQTRSSYCSEQVIKSRTPDYRNTCMYYYRNSGRMKGECAYTLDTNLTPSPGCSTLDSAINRINHCPVEVKSLCVRAQWPIRPELIPVSIQWVTIRKTNCAIQWIEIYSVERVVHRLNNCVLKPKQETKS